MIDFVIGEYIKKDTLIHNLDPRTKIIITFLFCISIFIINSFVGYLILTLFILLAVYLSDVSLKTIFKGAKPIFILILITIIFNLFFTQGKPVLSIYNLNISDKGIILSLLLVIRLLLLLLATSILTLTTSPIEITDGFELLFKPMKKLRLPIHEISMMMSIALRFIPTLAEETDKIMKAQMSRGADFESGNIVRRAKALIPILIPLFIAAFKRADELAIAMEARCYRGSEGRTKYKKLKFKQKDIFSLIFGFFCIIVAIYLG